MIPVKLRIEGLYSYQDVQHIDFRKLVGSSVFGIFGKVGSGKTSLLEAISFALYGKTERLNSQDNRLYNMMNLKSKRLFIDFEFEAGTDQQLYKFVYETKRHPKKHHEIGSGERRTFIWQDNAWHPIGNEKEDISVLSKQILGLDYDNFKRTIIIPQNQFREFLELSPTDRTKMMNQLFKLDQYDLAGRVSKLVKANEHDFSRIEGLLAPLKAVTPEAIEQADSELAEIGQILAKKEQQISALEPVETELLLLKKQSETLATARIELTHWLTNEPTYRKIQADITQYEECRLLFQASLVALDKLQDKRNGLIDAKKKAQSKLDAVTVRLPNLITVYDSAKRVYEHREQLQDQIDELDTAQEIRTSQESVGIQIKKRATLTALSNNQEATIDQQKAERKKHQVTIDNLSGQESNLDQLYKVQHWFGLYKPIKERANDLQAQVEQYKKEVDQLKQQKNNALDGFAPDWTELPLKVLPNTIKKALLQLETIEEERALTHQQTLLRHELQRYADALTEGEPCPMCGSVHHPQKLGSDSVVPDVVKSESALKKVKERLKEMTALQLKINELETKLRGVHENGKRLIRERGEVVEQLIGHEDKFIWTEFSKEQEGDVGDAIVKENGRQKQLQDAQDAVRKINAQIEEIEQAHKLQEKEINDIDNAISGLNGQIQTQVKSLKHYPLEEVTRWSLTYIGDLRESLHQQYEQTKRAFNDAERNRNEAEKEEVALGEQVQQLEKQLIDLTADLVAGETALNQNLIEKGLIREQVEQILRTNIDVLTEKKRVRDYTDKLNSLQAQVADLETDLTEKPFDPTELRSLQEELKTIRAEKDALNKAYGKAGNVLASLQTQWTEKQKYQQRYDELDLRRQDLKDMESLFRKQGFVDYVSSVYLNNLCQSANERFFKLTNNQLKLELDDKNGFQVRDFMNGGEVRSVKTLSGGQTFQAALSLALALSDNIQHLTKAKQNLFFLDEGFGTLDKDSLQTVFKTLKALRSENRVVGIISHVEELQYEVDHYIRAENTENGSRITCSWE